MKSSIKMVLIPFLIGCAFAGQNDLVALDAWLNLSRYITEDHCSDCDIANDSGSKYKVDVNFDYMKNEKVIQIKQEIRSGSLFDLMGYDDFSRKVLTENHEATMRNIPSFMFVNGEKVGWNPKWVSGVIFWSYKKNPFDTRNQFKNGDKIFVKITLYRYKMSLVPLGSMLEFESSKDADYLFIDSSSHK